jgi:hypothetical protein
MNNAPSYVGVQNIQRNDRGTLTLVTTPQVSAKTIVAHYHEVLIAAITSVDRDAVDVRAHEAWTTLKIHAIPLRRFMGRGTEGIQKLRAEIEAENPGVVIPRAVRWLGNPRRIKERYHDGDIQKSSAVFVVKNPDKAKEILERGSVFVGGSKYVVEPFVDDGPDSLCAKCCEWGHIQEKCQSPHPRCGLCAEVHLTADHKCRMPSCTAKGSNCLHTDLQCVSCGREHPAASPTCPARREAIQRAREARPPQGQGRRVRSTTVQESSPEETAEATAPADEHQEPQSPTAQASDAAEDDTMDEDTEPLVDDTTPAPVEEDATAMDTTPPPTEEDSTAMSEATPTPML